MSVSPAILDMMDHFGVMDECRAFLSQQQTLYIDGEFTTGQGPEQLDHFLRTKAVWINV